VCVWVWVWVCEVFTAVVLGPALSLVCTGLAAAKRAAETYKKKVLLLDFVKPSPAGTKWGLGGTCVNVGCIPKKLFHTAALYGETRHASGEYGWEEAGKTFKWATLMQNVNDYIRSLNFSYRGEMVESGVKYKNALGSFVDPHTIKMVNRRKRESTATTRRVLIAVGGRPRPLACPGGECVVQPWRCVVRLVAWPC